MRKNFVSKLYEKLLNDNNYKEYCRIYEKENYIDLELLKNLLNTHHDLYYLFLKSHLLLNFENKDKIMPKLNKDLKDFKHLNDKILRINDLELILIHYYSNFSRCQSTIKKIITNKLISKIERELLFIISKMDIEEQIRPTFTIDDED